MRYKFEDIYDDGIAPIILCCPQQCAERDRSGVLDLRRGQRGSQPFILHVRSRCLLPLGLTDKKAAENLPSSTASFWALSFGLQYRSMPLGAFRGS
ncbi:MAG TPA: hypothetical protein DCG90_07285 [Sphingobium sp.]|nr:hypothetical protein [Sphingobium sp.]